MMVLREISIAVGEKKKRAVVAVGVAALIVLVELLSQTKESDCDTHYRVLFSPTGEHSGCVTTKDAHMFQSLTRK